MTAVRLFCVPVALFGIVAALFAPATARPARSLSGAGTSTLAAGESIYSAGHDELVSAARTFKVDLQQQSVQVLQDLYSGHSWIGEELTWSSAPYSGNGDPATRLTMQTDGNLVLYRVADNRALWNTHTGGSGTDNRLVVQDDGNLVMYTSAGRAVWWTGSGPVLLGPGGALTAGGRLVNRFLDGATGSRDLPVTLTMQTDGNLVAYYGTSAVWSTHTHVAGSRMSMQSNGDVVVYSPDNRALWHSASYVKSGFGYLDVVYCGGSGTPIGVKNGATQHLVWWALKELSCS